MIKVNLFFSCIFNSNKQKTMTFSQFFSFPFCSNFLSISFFLIQTKPKWCLRISSEVLLFGILECNSLIHLPKKQGKEKKKKKEEERNEPIKPSGQIVGLLYSSLFYQPLLFTIDLRNWSSQVRSVSKSHVQYTCWTWTSWIFLVLN